VFISVTLRIAGDQHDAIALIPVPSTLKLRKNAGSLTTRKFSGNKLEQPHWLRTAQHYLRRTDVGFFGDAVFDGGQHGDLSLFPGGVR